MTFETLGLSTSLLKALIDTGYTEPSPIQRQTIPVILARNDIMACAQTGTGKTAGFVLPILQLLSAKPIAKSRKPLVLVLTPTRELAAQIQESVLTYGKYERINSAVVFGGVNINPQKDRCKMGSPIIIAY